MTRQTIEGVIFTCSACERTNTEPIEYSGPPGDKAAALAFVTGCYPAADPKDPPKRRGPICANCLRHWQRMLRNNHVEQCASAALAIEARAASNGRGMVFTTHVSMTSGRVRGVWIASDMSWQEIPIDADDNRPRRGAWRKGRA